MTKQPSIMPRLFTLSLTCALALSACGGDKDAELKPQTGADGGTGSGSPTPDSGVPGPGMRADGGIQAADGSVPQTECAQDSQCAAGESCLTVDAEGDAVACGGAAECFCAKACDFTNLTAGCATGEVCVFAGEGATVTGRGVCIMSAGGTQTQGAACTATFNGQGQYVTDTCDVGVICRGPISQQANAGECVRLCDPANTASCAALGAYTCAAEPMATVGLCLSAVPTVADIGEACTAGTTCDGMICIDVSLNMTPAQACASSCGGTDQCPANAICAGNACIATCTPGAAGACAGNAATACHTIAPNEGVCLGKCTTNADCVGVFGMRATCTVATGICSR